MRDSTFRAIFPLLKDKPYAKAPMIAADHLAFILNKQISEVCCDGNLLGKGLLEAAKLYDSDFIIVFADTSVEAEAMGAGIKYCPQLNPHIERNLDFDEVQEVNIVEIGRIPQLFKAANICRAEKGAQFPIFLSCKDPFSLAALVTGPERFLVNLLEQPEKMEPVLKTCTSNQVGLVRSIVQHGFIPLIGAPISSGSLIGPIWFEKYAKPALTVVLNEIGRLSSFKCLHICGEISSLTDNLPSLNLNVLSFEQWCDALWKKLPGTIPMGYVPTHLFTTGKKADVQIATRECHANLPKPCMLSTACDLPANANIENVKTMMNLQF